MARPVRLRRLHLPQRSGNRKPGMMNHACRVRLLVSMFSIIVHGGAGAWKPDHESGALSGVSAAAQAGIAILSGGGSALDAVVAAVVALENNPIFNAGTGSVLNAAGDVEMDASVMIGRSLRAGGVTCLRRQKNPILVARRVMEATSHVLLCGEGAQRFARTQGFPDHDPITPARREDYRQKRPGGIGGTVGAVALDATGNFAAATSTGGISLKLPGRVGDTPVPGAGNYAIPVAASSFTGNGELALRFLATKTACDLIARGSSAGEAVERTLARMAAIVGRDAGLIAIDAQGRIGVGHLTEFMPHAYSTAGAGLATRMRVE
jgi:beta-aspartyl-peptidase (threonine type)